MSQRNKVLIYTHIGLRVLISDILCVGMKIAVFMGVGVGAAARCVTDIAVATKNRLKGYQA